MRHYMYLTRRLFSTWFVLQRNPFQCFGLNYAIIDGSISSFHMYTQIQSLLLLMYYRYIILIIIIVIKLILDCLYPSTTEKNIHHIFFLK